MQCSVAVIVLNYKRPQNIGAIVRAAREGLPSASIFVLDQAESDDLHQRGDIPWPEVWLKRSGANNGPGARIALAGRLPYDHYLAIDDDTFLTPAQMAALAQRLARDPDRAHGIWGQRLEAHEAGVYYRHAISRVDAEVSILNMVYAFTRRQAHDAIALAARIGLADLRAAGPCDDIILSAASPKPPLCHDLGDLNRCASSDEPGIAQWRASDFGARRDAVVGDLLARRSIAVFRPATDAR
jgi:hypothetical protein